MKKVSGVLELGGIYGGKSWSSHQQDRIYNPDGICPCIATTKGDIIPKILIDMEKKYRIRRLTEKECFRLMDVPEDDIDKMVSNISGTQCYKLAGNSIVVSCLYHIFRKMFVEKDNESNDGQLSLF